MRWPTTAADLCTLQARLASAAGRVEPLAGFGGDALLGGCFVCFDGADRAFAAAATTRRGRPIATALTLGQAVHPYEVGLLALREGAVLERAVRGLPGLPDVLLVNATGADHPRRAGLAVHLGAVLAVPTIGVTDRPLAAHGSWPAEELGAASVLVDDAGRAVGAWLRTRAGRRPVAVHSGWRTTVELAVAVTLAAVRRARTPEPLRQAREAARRTRSAARGAVDGR